MDAEPVGTDNDRHTQSDNGDAADCVAIKILAKVNSANSGSDSVT